ncbi:MAG: hypothetical protein ACRDD8_16365 [Bacteroidales bacterium]
MNKASENYNKAFCFMTNVGRDGVSKRLSQLLTFHTVFWISAHHKDGNYTIEDLEMLDKIIGEELEENKNGNISNNDYDGGKLQYDIDFFTDTYIKPNRTGKKVVRKPTKPEWGQEVVEIKKEVVDIKKPEIVKSDTVNLVAVLGYANGTQITRMINSTKPELGIYKPYTSVKREKAIEIMKEVLKVATKEKTRIITKFLEKESA